MEEDPRLNTSKEGTTFLRYLVESQQFLYLGEKSRTYLCHVFGECSGNVQTGEVFSPPCTVPYLDTAPEYSLSSCLQPWPFQNGTSCEEIPNYLEQLVDSCLQAEPPLEIPLALAQDNLPCSPESFQPALTCLGSGSPEAPDPSSSFDCSYSPSQMPPFAPLGYSCPAVDGRSCMYPSSEERTCQSHNHVPHTASLPTCYCTPCGSQHLETFRAPEYFPYATLDCKDYAPSVSVAEDFWKDRSWDLCYS